MEYASRGSVGGEDSNFNDISMSRNIIWIFLFLRCYEKYLDDVLANPFKGLENEKNKKAALEDMKFVKTQFELLQMNAIVEKITKDMKID